MRKEKSDSEGRKYWKEKAEKLQKENIELRDKVKILELYIATTNRTAGEIILGKNAEIIIAQHKKYIDDKDRCYRELNDKYNFVLKKLNSIPEIQKQTDEMIKFYNYMESHDRIAGPVFGFIAGVVISIILFSIL